MKNSNLACYTILILIILFIIYLFYNRPSIHENASPKYTQFVPNAPVNLAPGDNNPLNEIYLDVDAMQQHTSKFSDILSQYSDQWISQNVKNELIQTATNLNKNIQYLNSRISLIKSHISPGQFPRFHSIMNGFNQRLTSLNEQLESILGTHVNLLNIPQVSTFTPTIIPNGNVDINAVLNKIQIFGESVRLQANQLLQVQQTQSTIPAKDFVSFTNDVLQLDNIIVEINCYLNSIFGKLSPTQSQSLGQIINQTNAYLSNLNNAIMPISQVGITMVTELSHPIVPTSCPGMVPTGPTSPMVPLAPAIPSPTQKIPFVPPIIPPAAPMPPPFPTPYYPVSPHPIMPPAAPMIHPFSPSTTSFQPATYVIPH